MGQAVGLHNGRTGYKQRNFAISRAIAASGAAAAAAYHCGVTQPGHV